VGSVTLRRRGGGVCASSGFLASGVAAGIKRSGALDLALIYSDRPTEAAGLFTTNKVVAAPVVVSRRRVAKGSARAVIVNSGGANACTGERGYRDALEMAELASSELGVDPEEVLVCSTGLIGSYLPMDRIRDGIGKAAALLDADDQASAQAIMTTDTRRKLAAVAHPAGWNLGGIAKGAGMIAPDMATMLAFITTDARVGAKQLKEVLTEAAGMTFNSITVDGDKSTNDTLLAFANGASDATVDSADFAHAMHSVCRELAEQIVADGEGASKFVRIKIGGAATEGEARKAARAVAGSTLVKTAVYGQDANWGRVAAAVGSSGASADFERLSISMAGVSLFRAGELPLQEAVAQARMAMASSEIVIECDLAIGSASAEVLTSDLTPDYVRLNAEYET
jgi:glutamate N-acetyltransferase / amino-acid N-acetyltransferase